MNSISTQHLSVSLDGVTVLDDVSLNVDSGSCTALIGPNGSGKTTMLRALAGLVKYTGRVRLGDGDGSALRGRQRSRLVAYAPQEPLLPPDLTVLELVLLGRAPHLGSFGNFSATDHDLAAQAIDRLDLAALAHRRLSALSGGERRRAALAQALAQQTPILLLDEPTTALDLGHQQLVLELVDRLRRDDGLTVVMVLHDPTLAGQYADQLLLLQKGQVAAAGRPEQVLEATMLAVHYAASLEVVTTGNGIAVHPVRPARVEAIPTTLRP